MATLSRIACIAVLALAGAGCAGSTPTSYNDQVEHNFVKGCTNAGGPEDVCTRAYVCIKGQLSFADFKAADKAADEHKAIDPKTQAILVNCVTQSR